MKIESPRADAKRAAFAIECRKVRLWIAANPGSSSFEMRSVLGGHVEMALAKMVGMQIIRCERGTDKSGRKCLVWFPVPQ